MKRETKQNIYAYDSEGNIVDTTTGIFNLNFGQGTPYGTGTSTTFGIFTLTSDSEPIVDYTAGQGCKMDRKSNCVSCEIANSFSNSDCVSCEIVIQLSKLNCDCEKLRNRNCEKLRKIAIFSF